MSTPDDSAPPPPIHASCVAIDGRAVLLTGRSGTGKSDLALRLIDRGATLVSDDYTEVVARGGTARAAPPPRIAGRIEVRGLGIVALPHVADVPIALLVDLDRAPERMPAPATRAIAGVPVPAIALAPFEASAPIKVEQALRSGGVRP